MLHRECCRVERFLVLSWLDYIRPPNDRCNWVQTVKWPALFLSFFCAGGCSLLRRRKNFACRILVECIIVFSIFFVFYFGGRFKANRKKGRHYRWKHGLAFGTFFLVFVLFRKRDVLVDNGHPKINDISFAHSFSHSLSFSIYTYTHYSS